MRLIWGRNVYCNLLRRTFHVFVRGMCILQLVQRTLCQCLTDLMIYSLAQLAASVLTFGQDALSLSFCNKKTPEQSISGRVYFGAQWQGTVEEVSTPGA